MRKTEKYNVNTPEGLKEYLKDEIENSFQHEDIYEEETLINAVSDDFMDSAEGGFMMGYLEA